MIPNNPLHAEIAKLRQQLADRDAVIADLRKAGDGDAHNFTGLFGMSRKEAEIAGRIMSAGRISRDSLYHAIYGACVEADQPEPKILDVYVCKMRKKLAPHDITIKTIWGYGYEMDRASADRLRALAVPSPSIVPTLREMAE